MPHHFSGTTDDRWDLCWVRAVAAATGLWFESRMPHHYSRGSTDVWTVYVLRSLKNGRLYTGSTDDVERRIAEHARGKTPYTRHAGPFELVYTEACSDRLQARRRERYLKTGVGREELVGLLGSTG
jgi:putative endonuclease